MEFSDLLKKLREEKNFSVRQLATYSGVSAGYLSQLETGERGKPSAGILKKLYKPLGVSYEYLLQEAGYLDSDEKIEIEVDNPEYDLSYKEWSNSPEENRRRALDFLRYLNEEKKKEKKKRPGRRNNKND